MMQLYEWESAGYKMQTPNETIPYDKWLNAEKERLEAGGRIVEIRKAGDMMSLWVNRVA